MSSVARLFACVLLIILASRSLTGLAGQQYSFKKEIQIGGAGGWDFIDVDPAARRLYVPHGAKVFVIDTDKNTVVGSIADTPGIVHQAIAVAPGIGKAVVRNGGQPANVGIVDLKTGTMASKVEPAPSDFMLYEPAQKEFWLFRSDATVIDGASGKIVATIPIGGALELAAADPKANRVYVNVMDKNTVVALDTQTHKVVATWPIAPGEMAAGMAIDVEHHRLFIGCHNNLMVMMDSTNGKILAQVPAGKGIDGTWYDPATRLVFSSAGDGTVTIAKEETSDKLTILQILKTAIGARTMALDTKNHSIYIARLKYSVPDSSLVVQANGDLRIQGTDKRPDPTPESFSVLVYGLN